MNILSIETSCDESAISIIKASGSAQKPKFTILANNIASQIKIHAEYGGVFPAIAKREHGKALVPILIKTLKESGKQNYNLQKPNYKWDTKTQNKVEKILEREPELLVNFLNEIPKIKKPKIDLIAITTGPGLEPALWVGISFAKALSLVWDIPVIPVNHMEGHVLSPILLPQILSPKNQNEKIAKISFPALAVLISGGHTELVLMKDWLKYKKIGETRDDAVGEAFDKVARMLGLPYPGGPEISRLAEKQRKLGSSAYQFVLPRPMIHSKDFDFSFSGLKTAVLYTIQKIPKLDDDIKSELACEFENAVTDVLIHKTKKAVEKYKIKTILVGGGVAANKHIKNTFEKTFGHSMPESSLGSSASKLEIFFPRPDLSTDNSLMIALAGYFQFSKKKKGVPLSSLKANGNLELK